MALWNVSELQSILHVPQASEHSDGSESMTGCCVPVPCSAIGLTSDQANACSRLPVHQLSLTLQEACAEVQCSRQTCISNARAQAGHAQALVWVHLQVYILGGMDGTGQFLTSALAYDSILDTDNTTLADLPSPRATFTAAVLNSSIHVIGGFSSSSAAASNRPEACSLIFDTQANSWSQGPCLVQVQMHRSPGSPAQ